MVKIDRVGIGETSEATKKAFAEMEKILRRHNIKLLIYACGCCHSPEIIFEYKGKEIVHSEADNFDMFDDNETKE